MNLAVFNACLLIGWLLVLAGGVWLNPGAGLAVAGLLLIVLTLLSARIAGGLVVPEPKKAEAA
jgi:hypothetical protein